MIMAEYFFSRARFPSSLALLVLLALLSAVPSCGNAANGKATEEVRAKGGDANAEQVLVAVMTPSRPSAEGQTSNKTGSRSSLTSHSATLKIDHSADDTTAPSKKKRKKKKSSLSEKAVPSPVKDGILVQLQPNDFHFGEQSVGSLEMVTVNLLNLDSKSSLNLNSLAGSSPHFHASSFAAKVVAAKNTTHFQIAFLPRSIGRVEANFTLRTSLGDISYVVSGIGVESPYLLRPFVGIRVPVNITYQPLISIHNPYSTALQVIEMYTSGGNLNLELPGSKLEPTSQTWEVSAYETKNVMRAHYVGAEAHNFTGYIRLQLRHPQASNETIVLPVEVEVTNETGLFSTVETLDFGTVRNLDEPRNLSLFLLNSGPSTVRVTSVSANPPIPALTILFTPTVLKSRRRYSKVAYLVFSGSQCEKCGYVRGTIDITAMDGEVAMHLSIPYQARVLDGTLHYTVAQTSFHITGPPYYPTVHSFPLTNTFNTTIVILDARFPPEVRGLLSVNDFSPPVVVEPHQSVTPFSVSFLSNSSDMSLTTSLRIITNASVFAVPFQCYNGRLKVVADSTGNPNVSFGIIGTEESHSRTFKLANTNPVEIMIKKIAVSIKRTKIKLVSLRSLKSGALRRIALATQSVAIPGQHEATFAVELKAPLKEGHMECNITVKTQLQTFHIPLTYQAVPGALRTIPQSLTIPPAFPGIVGDLQLRVRSLFKQDLTVLSVQPEVEDPRFQFEMTPGHVVLSDKKTTIGTVTFNPLLDGNVQQYVGVGTQGTTSRLIWLQNILKDTFQPDEDIRDYEVLRSKWAGVQEAGRSLTSPNATYLLSTDLVENYRLTFQASLRWPSISQDTTLQLPLTHVGKEAVAEFRVFNPSNTRLVVQLIMLHDYPEPQRILDVLSDRLDTDTIDLDGSRNSFHLMEARENPTIGPPFTIILVLQANESSLVKIAFKPGAEKHFTSLVLLKNNLTVLDAVQLTGQGIAGSLTVNGVPCNGPSKLNFAMSHSLAEQCTKVTRPLQLQRTVVAHNNGLLPLHIVGMLINDMDCDGYGFTINNCRRFVLKPNATRTLKITFTPDFSMSRVSRKLRFNVREIGFLEVNLVGTIPREVLPICLRHLPRPWWERSFTNLLLYSAVIFFIAASVRAYSDAEKRHGTFGRPPSDIQPPFDLRKSSAQRKHPSSSGRDNTDSDDSPPPSASYLGTKPAFGADGSAPHLSLAEASTREPAPDAMVSKRVMPGIATKVTKPAPRPGPRKGTAPLSPPAAALDSGKADASAELAVTTSPLSLSQQQSKTSSRRGSAQASSPVTSTLPTAAVLSSGKGAGSATAVANDTEVADHSCFPAPISTTPTRCAPAEIIGGSAAITPPSGKKLAAKPKKQLQQHTPTSETKSKLVAQMSSESLSSNDSPARSASPLVERSNNASASASPSAAGGDKKASAKKTTKAMLREEKREQRRQRDRERLQALQHCAPAGSNSAIVAGSDTPINVSSSDGGFAEAQVPSAPPSPDTLDLLLSSVERDSSVKYPKASKASPIAVVKPGMARTQAPLSTTKECPIKKEMSKTSSMPAGAMSESSKASDDIATRRPSQLFKANAPAAPATPLSLTVTEGGANPDGRLPTSPHEMASAIASRVGLAEEKLGPVKPVVRAASVPPTSGTAYRREYALKLTGAVLQQDFKKPSPPAGRSASEVFRRYKDNPSVQPEEFRPRAPVSTSAPVPAPFPYSYSSSMAPPSSGAAFTTPSTSSPVRPPLPPLPIASAPPAWPPSPGMPMPPLPPPPQRMQPGHTSPVRGGPLPPPSLPFPRRPTPPGLSLTSGPPMASVASTPAVYSHATVEKLAMQCASGQQQQQQPIGLPSPPPLPAPDMFLPGIGAGIDAMASPRPPPPPPQFPMPPGYDMGSKMRMAPPPPPLHLPPLPPPPLLPAMSLPSLPPPPQLSDDGWSLLRAENGAGPGSDSGSSTSPNWDSPGDPGGFESLAASTMAFQQQMRYEGHRLPMPRNAMAPVAPPARIRTQSNGTPTSEQFAAFPTELKSPVAPPRNAWQEAVVSARTQPKDPSSGFGPSMPWKPPSSMASPSSFPPPLPPPSFYGHRSSTPPGVHDRPSASAAGGARNWPGTERGAGDDIWDADVSPPPSLARGLASFHPRESSSFSTRTGGDEVKTPVGKSGVRKPDVADESSMDTPTSYLKKFDTMLPELQSIWGDDSTAVSSSMNSVGVVSKPTISAIGSGLGLATSAASSVQDEPKQTPSEKLYNPFKSGIWGFSAQSLYKSSDE